MALFGSSLSLYGAELGVEYTLIARSGATAIPGGFGQFTGFGDVPAIDDSGNVVFTGTGGADGVRSYQSGVYTYLGSCCQKVADRKTLVPGGGGVTFDTFYGTDLNDIDDGRVAFRADITESGNLFGVYSNVGQASAGALVELAVEDGVEWGALGYPWVDGDYVALRGQRLIPQEATELVVWDGLFGGVELVNPGTGYQAALNTQLAISGDASAFLRYNSNTTQVVIANGSQYQVLAAIGGSMPGADGGSFRNFGFSPALDRGGLDAAFTGNGTTGRGVYKRSNGGALQEVADTATQIPGATNGWVFSYFEEAGVSVANGHVAFLGLGPLFLYGIYTDIDGALSVIVDTQDNNTITLDGKSERIVELFMGNKAFAYTSSGYEVVFWASLQSGGYAIIKATIGGVAPPPTTNSFRVYKDFSDNNSASVSINLSCTSGTVTNNPQWAREGSPALFTISGAAAGTTCRATEPTVPTGYTKNETDCQNGDPLNGSCTIVNTKVAGSSGSFTVFKNFSDDNTASVSVTLSCTSGTVINNPQWASENSPAVFAVSGAAAGTTCTATENSVPAGYIKAEYDCQDGDPLNGWCVLINNKSASATDSFTVYKDFSDNSSTSVSIQLTCTSGTVTNNPQWAREGAPAVFTISGAAAGTTCRATEPTVPTGYSKNETDCQNGDPLNGSCTIVNTKVTSSTSSFTVFKDFSDNNTASVSIYLTCTSGTVTNNPQWAREGVPAVFSISGAVAGTTCRATEPTVPTGYTKNETDCQNGDPLNGSCVIVNTRVTSGGPRDIVRFGFETGQSEGWSLGGETSIDSSVAIGNYSLRHDNDGAISTRSVSTVGYTNVSITMSVAGESLEKNDECLAEVSTNRGVSWSTVASIVSDKGDRTFRSGTLSPSGASGNSDLRLRFQLTGSGKGDTCWGDEVIVRGTPST